jgi:hypothetical protein
MIAHVAEAGEQRGRVVLWLGAEAWPSRPLIDATIMVAQVFGAEIESLFVEDRQLLELKNLPFVREVGLSGQGARDVAEIDIEHEMKLAAGAAQREVGRIIRESQVVHRERTMRGEPLATLAMACAETGPWNVVAIGDPAFGSRPGRLLDLFETVLGMTGIVMTGPTARTGKGPVVALVEDVDRIEPMIRAAERLSSGTGASVTLLLAAPSEAAVSFLDGQARLLLGGRIGDGLTVASHLARDSTDLANALSGLDIGFFIAQFGGTAVPATGEASAVISRLGCPLFLVR